MSEAERKRIIEELEMNANIALLLRNKEETITPQKPQYQEYDPLSLDNGKNV